MLPELAKLAIAPLFVAVVTLVARRLGPSAAGFLAGLPVVAAPILGLLVAAHGSAFGAVSALGTAIGAGATMVFALVYARLAPRLRPPLCLLAAYGAYFAVAGLSIAIPVSWPFAIAVPAAAWLAVLRAFPRAEAALESLPAPAWDIPVRILATLALVTIVTSLARFAGPELAGLFTPIPIITAVLAVFSHGQGGPVFCAVLLRSLVRGMVTFVSFFWLVAALLPHAHAIYVFGCGALGCLLLHAALGRRGVAARAASQYE